VQKVVNALVATMHYIATHSAADIAAHLPADFVSNSLITKDEYVTRAEPRTRPSSCLMA